MARRVDLEGRVALVTGAAGAIGRSIARRLAEAGAQLAVTDLREDVYAVAETLTDEGHRAIGLVGDLTDESATRGVIAGTAKQLGPVDILVNNAGICPARPFIETPANEWDQVFAVNVRTMFLACREVLPSMAERGGGTIINIASNAGKTAEPLIVPYSASKFAVIGLTQGLAREFAPARIRVNCVCPAMCETEMMEQLAVDYARLKGGSPEEHRDTFPAEIPWGRMARPDDVAHAVVFLCDPASEFITGHALNVTGGLEMH